MPYIPIIKNIVLEGGGVRGPGEVGVLAGLFEKLAPNMALEKVCGTSAGAIVGMMLALGFSTAELKTALSNIKFKKCADDNFGAVGDAARFVKHGGLHTGDYLVKLLKKYTKEKTGNPNLTFRQLHDLRMQELKANNKTNLCDLYIVATNVDTYPMQSEVFSFETHPDLEIWKAVRASFAIPVFFIPQKIDDCRYADGGIFRNYAIDVFDKAKYMDAATAGTLLGEQPAFNYHTLGIRLDRPDEIAMFQGHPHYVKCEGVISLIRGYISALLDSQDDNHRKSIADQWRTIYCDTAGISPLHFDITPEEVEFLFTQGLKGVDDYIERQKHYPENLPWLNIMLNINPSSKDAVLHAVSKEDFNGFLNQHSYVHPPELLLQWEANREAINLENAKLERAKLERASDASKLILTQYINTTTKIPAISDAKAELETHIPNSLTSTNCP